MHRIGCDPMSEEAREIAEKIFVKALGNPVAKASYGEEDADAAEVITKLMHHMYIEGMTPLISEALTLAHAKGLNEAADFVEKVAASASRKYVADAIRRKAGESR